MANEDIFWENLASKLKALREKRGLAQYDVAEKLEIGTSAYRSYELNMRRIPVDVLTRVAALYNVSVDELLGNSVRPNTSANIIHGNFTKEQLQKIQKYAELVSNDEL